MWRTKVVAPRTVEWVTFDFQEGSSTRFGAVLDCLNELPRLENVESLELVDILPGLDRLRLPQSLRFLSLKRSKIAAALPEGVEHLALDEHSCAYDVPDSFPPHLRTVTFYLDPTVKPRYCTNNISFEPGHRPHLTIANCQDAHYTPAQLQELSDRAASLTLVNCPLLEPPAPSSAPTSSKKRRMK